MSLGKSVLCAVAVVTLAGRTFGQTFREPKIYMWGAQPPSTDDSYSFDPSNRYIRLSTLMSAFYPTTFGPNEDSSDGSSPTRDVRNNFTGPTGETGGFTCGKSTAYQVFHRVMNDTATPAQKICIIIQDFGCDHPFDSDYHIITDSVSGKAVYDVDSMSGSIKPWLTTDGDYIKDSDFDTRFFRPEDRLSWMIDDSFPDNARNVLVTEGHPEQGKKIGDSGTGRTYRHPFLINAYPLPPADGATEPGMSDYVGPTPPLRVWMQDFISGYKSVQLINSNIPDPDYFAFDTESTIAGVDDSNAMFMLESLFEDRNHDPATYGPDHGYWNWKHVPGYNNKTLADLLADAQASTYFKYYENQSHAKLVDLLQRASREDNRAAAAWWYHICKRVQEAVMKKCAYDPILAAFPACKVSNYDTSTTDGVPDGTGWMLDRAPLSVFNHDNVTDPTGHSLDARNFRVLSTLISGVDTPGYQIANAFPPRNPKRAVGRLVLLPQRPPIHHDRPGPRLPIRHARHLRRGQRQRPRLLRHLRAR